MSSLAAALSSSFSNLKFSATERRNSQTISDISALTEPSSSPSVDSTTFAVAETEPPSSEAYETVEAALVSLQDDMSRISRSIHATPEVAFREFRTIATMSKIFEQHQEWKVTKGAHGLPTCMEALFEHRRGGRSLVFIADIDALPDDQGHGNGHNLSAACALALGLAVSQAMTEHDIPGRICVLACPGSGTGGKILLLRQNVFRPYDAAFAIQPGSFDGHVSHLASAQCEVEYQGTPTHATAPSTGRNALDAAVMAYTSISLLRQTLPSHARVAGLLGPCGDWRSRTLPPSSDDVPIVPNGSTPPTSLFSRSPREGSPPMAVSNAFFTGTVPARAQMLYTLRCDQIASMQPLQKRLTDCFEAAALATGTQMVKCKWPAIYFDFRVNASMAADYSRNMRDQVGVSQSTDNTPMMSTDLGNVSYELPVIQPVVDICCGEEALQHTRAFTRLARSERAHDKCFKACKGIARTAMRLMLDSAFCHEVKNAHELDKRRRLAAAVAASG